MSTQCDQPYEDYRALKIFAASRPFAIFFVDRSEARKEGVQGTGPHPFFHKTALTSLGRQG